MRRPTTSGAWSCQVTLPSDESAAGYYEFTATGQTSGVSESGAFTVTAPPPPAVDPTPEPTQEPTAEPTAEPTQEPTAEPTVEPTQEPTAEPTVEPTH
jgi:outer membrane biosynthesis protein TonB